MTSEATTSARTGESRTDDTAATTVITHTTWGISRFTRRA